jgi:hypothetical protein
MSLLIDISHLLNWSGRMSGIERVEFNIVSHYIQTDAQFISWSNDLNQFELCKKSRVEDLLKSISMKQQAESVQELSKSSKIISSIKSKIRKPVSLKQRTPSYDFQSSDRVLVLDGLWDKQNYIEGLKKISERAQVDHVVYDMIPVLYPGYVLEFISEVFENYMKTILPLCTNVYAISKNTVKDTEEVLVSWGCKKLPRINSFQLGDDILTHEKTTQDIPKGEFILATGTVEVRKNYPLLLYAYGLAREKNIDLPPTFIAGRRGWLSEDFQHVIDTDPYFRKKISILDNVTDNRLTELYKASLFTVCPSYYEGWGLPVRESLSYGKVTLSSDTSSLPEAGGDFADYFSPNNPEALLTLIKKYLDDDTRTKRQIYIDKNYQHCDWESAMINFSKQISSN